MHTVNTAVGKKVYDCNKTLQRRPIRKKPNKYHVKRNYYERLNKILF